MTMNDDAIREDLYEEYLWGPTGETPVIGAGRVKGSFVEEMLTKSTLKVSQNQPGK